HREPGEQASVSTEGGDLVGAARPRAEQVQDPKAESAGRQGQGGQPRSSPPGPDRSIGAGGGGLKGCGGHDVSPLSRSSGLIDQVASTLGVRVGAARRRNGRDRRGGVPVRLYTFRLMPRYAPPP